MTKTYNIPLEMSQESLAFWTNTLMQLQGVYNDCVNIIMDNNIPFSLKPVHEAVYSQMRSKYPSLPAQSIIKTYKTVISALRSIKKNKHLNGERPLKHSLSTPLDKHLYSKFTVDGLNLSGEVIGRPKYHKLQSFEQARFMFEHYKAKDPLLFIRDGRPYLSVPFAVHDAPMLSDECVGVDMGIKRLFTTSEGIAFRDKAYLGRRRKVRYLKSQLKSKGTKSAKRHLKRLKHAEYNLSNDMCHRATNALLQSTKAGVLVLEDLSKIKDKKSKNPVQTKRNNNRMSQVPFYKFKEILTYKAPLFGKKVETVSPSYTSQIDCRTGQKDGERRKIRYYCVDGVVLDADWNAAVNIGKRIKKHPLSNYPLPVDGGLTFLNGRRQSTRQSSKAAKSWTSPRL